MSQENVEMVRHGCEAMKQYLRDFPSSSAPFEEFLDAGADGLRE